MRKIYLFIVTVLTCFSMASAQTSITVNPATEYQTIWGFGGTGTGDATYIRAIVDLMGMSAYRQPLDGGTGDVVNGSGGAVTAADITSKNLNFKINTDVANFHKAIKAKGVTNIVATCWSPPASLKQNNCLCQKYLGLEANCCQGTNACGSYNCADALNYLKSEYYDEYGKFLVEWVKDFETKTTQKVYALNIQNEPFFNEPYSSGLLYDNTFGPCLQKVKTEFTSASLTTKFHGPEDMGNYTWMAGLTPNRAYIKTLLWSSTYRSMLDIFSVHSYTDGIAADLGSADGWTKLDTAVRKWNKDLWMTETDFQGTATWDVAFNMSNAIYTALKFGKVNAWIYWGMDGSNGMFTGGGPTPRLYACMHYFRFIRPGYKQIQCTETDPDIAAIAFKNGTDYTIVAINLSTTKTKTFTFNNFTAKPSYFHMYRSSATEQCAYHGKFTTNSFELTPKSIATLYFKASEPDVVYGPKAPTNLQATVVEDNKITVTWDQASAWTLAGSPVNISGYIVYINGVKKTPDGPTTKNTWTFTGLTKNTNYKIEIYTRDAMINQSPATALTVTTTCSDCGSNPPPPIDPEKIENSVSEGFLLSPNPANGIVKLTLPDASSYSLQILSLSGKVVLTQNNVSDGDIIDVSTFAPSMYIVIAKSGNKIYKAKLIKE